MNTWHDVNGKRFVGKNFCPYEFFMRFIEKVDLLTGIPEDLPQEWFQSLAVGANYKIERIVSKGHISPDDYWCDQDWDEWVLLLKGQAVLSFQEPPQALSLKAGQGVLIPAGRKHRVAFTEPEKETIWLAVHIGGAAGGISG